MACECQIQVDIQNNITQIGVDVTLQNVEIDIEYNALLTPINGSTIALPDLQLTVTANGQTQFNIFSTPAWKHELEVNGVKYYETIHYTIGMNGLNPVLNWLDEFPLEVSDIIKFRRFINN